MALGDLRIGLGGPGMNLGGPHGLSLPGAANSVIHPEGAGK